MASVSGVGARRYGSSSAAGALKPCQASDTASSATQHVLGMSMLPTLSWLVNIRSSQQAGAMYALTQVRLVIGESSGQGISARTDRRPSSASLAWSMGPKPYQSAAEQLSPAQMSEA